MNTIPLIVAALISDHNACYNNGCNACPRINVMALYEFLVHIPIPLLQMHSIYIYKHAYQQNIHNNSSHSTLEISMHIPSQDTCVIRVTENQAVKAVENYFAKHTNMRS